MPASPAISCSVPGRIAPSRWRWRWALGSVLRSRMLAILAPERRRRHGGNAAFIFKGSKETRNLLGFAATLVDRVTRSRNARPVRGGIVAEEFDLSSLSIDRRSFLRRGAIGGAGAVLLASGGMSTVLAACSSSSKPASSTTTPSGSTGATDLGKLTFQLSW